MFRPRSLQQNIRQINKVSVWLLDESIYKRNIADAHVSLRCISFRESLFVVAKIDFLATTTSTVFSITQINLLQAYRCKSVLLTKRDNIKLEEKGDLSGSIMSKCYYYLKSMRRRPLKTLCKHKLLAILSTHVSIRS